MATYAERLRKFNRAGDIEYELLENVANYIESLEMWCDELEHKRKGLEGQIQYTESAAFAAGYEAGKKEMTNKQEGYSSDAGVMGVETVEEHEDGSATYQFHMDDRTRGLLAEEGLKLILYCAAAKMDMQVVYDFIEDHMRYENDELTEYEFGVKDDEST